MLRNNEPRPDLPEPRLFLVIVFGIVLPTLTIVIELGSHMCAGSFFDPVPTLGHVFAVAAVPLANIYTVWALSGYEQRRLDSVIFAQAGAVAVAGVYALIFVPLVPVAVMALVILMGILPLTPLLAFLASVRGLRGLLRLRDALGRPRRRTVWAGLAAGIGVLVALQLPTAATRVLIGVAGSNSPSVSRIGLHWLRTFGQRELMLRACYQEPTGAADLLSALVNTIAPVSPDRMRWIYYRVTGRPFDTEPRPRLGRRSDRLEMNEWDVSQGGTEVGVVPLKGLSLASSRMDGSVDGRAALAYLEWTFELRNEAPIQREARAEVALPPGAVVSRVTLWIDGVEQEAAFAGRDASRRAYQRVVQARRDPILVTTTGPDRVLVQCFPVPPLGGVMKARLGITAPLVLESRARGALGLPWFAQRNFDVPASLGHAVWIASKDTFAAPPAPLVRQAAAGGEELRGRLVEPARPGPLAAVVVDRPDVTSWTADHGGFVRQTIRAEAGPRPSQLIAVVDGSAAMERAVPALEAALQALPKGLALTVLVAGDTITESHDLRRVDFEGGADSAAALSEAWDRAAARPGSAVLWIHGPQPEVLGPVAELMQRLERRADGPRVYSYAAAAGENRLLALLATSVHAVPRLREGPGDLQAFLAGLAGGERLVAVRERVAMGPGCREGTETSDHLARLWASGVIDGLARGTPVRAHERQAEALALATKYHLVTPVSGAVVLETKEQYEANDLEPTDPARARVPTVPEPGTWVLIALVAVVLAVAVRKRWAQHA